MTKIGPFISTGSIESLDQDLSATESAVGPVLTKNLTAEDQMRMRRAHHEDGVRSFVTKWVVGVFILIIFGVAAYSLLGSNADSVIRTADIVAKFYLPIVTLVLGHYFGASGR
jgi:hypothetical protein